MAELQRNTAVAPFRIKVWTGFGSVTRILVVVLVLALMSLPLFTTFNEILTKLAERSGFYNYLTQSVVPFETRAVAAVLRPLGIVATPTESHLYLKTAEGKITGVFFSWNCLGWQSAILLVLTFVTGLTGVSSWEKRIEVVLLGISGTFLINLIRITSVTLVAYWWGQFPATVVHDYGGTLFTVMWFFLFWWFAYNFIVEN